MTELPYENPCPVCDQTLLMPFQVIDDKTYHRCQCCEATVMAEFCRLGEAEEKAVYRLHDNHPDDPGYRRFLSKLATPLLAKLAPGMRGLDFGCGPGPALADMLLEQGMEMSVYDPFFAPDRSVLANRYDFVTCTEVVEHLYHPARIFRELDALLLPGGWLGIMTCFQTDDDRFANWHYRRDPTHVVFYREVTLAWLAKAMGWHMEVPVKDVALFRKGG